MEQILSGECAEWRSCLYPTAEIAVRTSFSNGALPPWWLETMVADPSRILELISHKGSLLLGHLSQGSALSPEHPTFKVYDITSEEHTRSLAQHWNKEVLPQFLRSSVPGRSVEASVVVASKPSPDPVLMLSQMLLLSTSP